MCYSPLKILNNSKNFSTLYDRVYNTVPCGHCGECLNRKTNDWVTRCYYEWQDVKKKGGFALFLTLTYSNDNLPLLALPDGSALPCFSKRDIQLFIDNVRKKIIRNINADSKLKYLVTSEFGGKTFRPHYHLLLFFDSLIPLHKVRNIIKDSWKHGFIKFGDNFGVISGINGINYVTKYIVKDIDFFSHPDFKLFEELPDDVRKDSFPFHLQSKSLGKCITTTFSIEQLSTGKLPLPSKGCYKMVRVPLYIDRKLFYFVDKYQSYHLNPAGVQMKLLRSKDYNLYLYNYINGINESLSTWLDPDSINHIQQFYKQSITAYGIKQVFQSFFNTHTVHEFIDYLTTRRDYSYLDYNSESIFYSDTQLSPADRLNRFNDSFQPISHELREEFQFQSKVLSNLYNNIDRELENFAQLFDLVRFLYGRYRNNNYYLKMLQHSKSKMYMYD